MEKSQRLIDAGIITKNDIDEYNKQNATGLIGNQIKEMMENAKNKEPSVIKDGVLVKAGNGDLIDGKYIVPNHVNEIAPKAFYQCYGLKKVIIPNGIDKIQYATFAHCTNLETVILPDSIEVIENDAFCGCGFKHIKLPENLKLIGRGAFLATKLESIEIPDRVEEIYNNAFTDNKDLVQVKLPSRLKMVRRHVFEGCDRLEEISIPEGVEEIRESAFNGCKNLTRVYLPQSLKSIDRDAFYNCISLTNVNANGRLEFKINMPSNIKFIYYNAFSGTPVGDFVREWADKNKITQWPGQMFEETKTK